MDGSFRPQRRLAENALATILVVVFGAPASDGSAETHAPRALEITYLTNEAFLLRCGEQKVLIDAFVPEAYRDYGFVPPAVWRSMVAGEPPFDGVDLALASHRHQDHFQPRAAAEFLSSHPETLLATSAEVVEHLRSAETSVPAGQVEIHWPEPRSALHLERQGIRVDLLHLPHGGARWKKIQNLGHVVHLCGQRVLHIGDAFETPEVFAHYAELLRDLDVSLIPAWFFFESDGPRVIRDVIGARHNVAMHIETRQIEAMADYFAEKDPSVAVFRRAMESRTFQ